MSLRDAVKKTEQISTGRSNMVVSASQGGLSARLVTYGYAFDQTRRLLTITVDYRKLVALEPGSLGGFKPADFVFDETLDRRHGLTMYMSSPAFLEPSFQNKLPVAARHREWIRFDAAELQKAAGALGPAQGLIARLTQGPTSPLSALDALSTGTARAKGQEQMDGVPTTRFSTTANMTRTGLLGQLAAQLYQIPRWRAEAWVDRSSLIRKVEFSSPAIASQGNAIIAVAFETGALGRPVAISEPPASETLDGAMLPH